MVVLDTNRNRLGIGSKPGFPPLIESFNQDDLNSKLEIESCSNLYCARIDYESPIYSRPPTTNFEFSPVKP
jgi:hypothetical protein